MTTPMLLQFMTGDERRAAWGRRTAPPRAGDIVGLQIDPAHEIVLARVRGWFGGMIKLTNVVADRGYFFVKPDEVKYLYRKVNLKP